MVTEEEQTQQLQNKVDRIKALSLLSNAHNLTPPQKKDDSEENQITIIRSLSSKPRLLTLFLRARGLVYDPNQNQLLQIRKPYMNVEGAAMLVDICSAVAEEAEWGNFIEEHIPGYVDHFFKENYPYFTLWHDEYDLNPMDFAFVRNTLQMFILSSFYKAKGGKMLNVISKTYSEDMLGKIISNDNQQKKEGFLERNNPFRKMV